MALAAAAARGEPAALAAIDARLASVARWVRHLDHSPSFADEVAQLVRIRLLVGAGDAPPRIADYEGLGTLDGFLKVCALRVAADLARRGRAHERAVRASDPVDASVPAPGADVELDYLRARHGADFDQAFRAALAACTPADRTLLRLFYVDRLTLGELASLHHVHLSTISRRIAGIRDGVKAATRSGLEERMGARPEELSSLLRALDSHLDVSVKRLLGGQNEKSSRG